MCSQKVKIDKSGYKVVIVLSLIAVIMSVVIFFLFVLLLKTYIEKMTDNPKQYKSREVIEPEHKLPKNF